ncbi:hypothetical protein [Hydrogenimonas thermophila]|uniref:Uncharacterized protein n=1 Tax=Hydrogenimonas thermophila TaxID=223786 RepID=A0A1I5N919_9BACT|nr:hypothetical protein [Hydrogenimonas thermophila]SFP17856.1 hypothetical protein SAMN05216234_1093 [Hydrogenimonas thermophila]
MINKQEILKKYNNEVVSRIVDFFYENKNTKSIIELNLSENDIDFIEEILFHFRERPEKLSQNRKAFVGLIFLIYVTYRLKHKLSYSSLWNIIIEDLEKYARTTTFFLDTYFISRKNPNNFLKESIELATKEFNLRNDFENRDEHQYLRNTILLQIGLLNNSIDNLKLWLSNYNLLIVISELLNVDSLNFSKEFSDGWRVLRRYRDNILSKEQVKNILNQNIWFKHLNLDELLKAAKQRVKKQLMITQDEDLPIFYLEKINYSYDGLNFTINAQDLYSLNLSGFRYEIYIDDEYKGILIANNSKELILESPIIISNPKINQIDLEVRNEDSDVVYATEITLFDFSEQMILFDEDGNICQNIFKKLNASKKYHILIDSDLDCNFNIDNQREYFEGYATLVPFVGYKDDCKIIYDNEVLFELNFKTYIEKPDFIDNLVLYTCAKTDYSFDSFVIDKEYIFELKVMHFNSDTEEISLSDLPDECKVIKWSYSVGYADFSDIQNNTIKVKLHPEMVVFPKHTIFLKYKGRVFKKVLNCNFIENYNKYKKYQLFKVFTDRRYECEIVDRSSFLTKYDILEYKYYLSDFSKSEKFYVKSKSNFYQSIKPNRIFKFNSLDGFGETIFISSDKFYTLNNSIFYYKNSDEYISLSDTNLNEIFIRKNIPQNSKLILLDQEFQYHRYLVKDLEFTDNKFRFDNKLISALLIHENNIIDSTYDSKFLNNFDDYRNFEVIKNLLLSNYIFLSKDSFTNFLRKGIDTNLKEFFSEFYSEQININGDMLKLNFSKYKNLIDHTLFSFKFDTEKSIKILNEIVLNRKENFMIDTPIVLFKLLQASNSNKLINYFYNYLVSMRVELNGERDEKFIKEIIDNLFRITTLKEIKEHSLKIAMHYINGKYYLKKALERLNG